MAPSMSEDWRLQEQERYLTGATLTRREWQQSRAEWDHDHCEFCWAKFGGSQIPNALRQGWTTSDGYLWICDQCFADFRERFNWQIS